MQKLIKWLGSLGESKGVLKKSRILNGGQGF